MSAASRGAPTPTSAAHSGRHTPNLLTVAEAAERLRVSRWFVYEHGAELGLVKVGGANRYAPEAIDSYLAERSVSAAPALLSVAPRRQRSPRKAARRVRLLDPATALRPETEGS